jgi:hypothetical protein
MRVRKAACVVATVTLVGGVGAANARAEPSIGMNYTHAAITPYCSLDGARSPIVLTYHEPGVRRVVRAQLAAMRAAGMQTISMLLWNMTNPGTHRWGVVSSAGGVLREPHRSNLIRFTRDVRDAGFQRLTVHFSPQWTNDPVGQYGPTGLIQDVWEPAKLDENWGFIRNARTLVKQHGPADTRFDIASGFPPSPFQPAFIIDRLKTYMAEMWTRYVAEFGKSDATISVIGNGPETATADRLHNLIEALSLTGVGLPEWFEIYADPGSPSAFLHLTAFDRALSARGLQQPIVIGDAAYESAAVAADIARFISSSPRPVLEVYQSWQATNGACFAAPYRGDAYRAALSGAPPAPRSPSPLPLAPIPTLSATVGPGSTITLKSAKGGRVTTLDAGRYRIVVDDRSRTESFHLTGPGVDERTGIRFRGRVTWTVDLGVAAPYGTTFLYRSDRSGALRRRFVVL